MNQAGNLLPDARREGQAMRLMQCLGQVESGFLAQAALPLKKKRVVWYKWTAAACLIVGLLALTFAGQVESIKPLQPEPMWPAWTLEKMPDEPAPVAQNHIVVNWANSVAMADMDVSYSENYLEQDEEGLLQAEEAFCTFTGIPAEIITGSAPDGWTLEEMHALYTGNWKNGERVENPDLHDYLFRYQTNDGGSVNLAVCPWEAPLRDCFFLSEEPMAPSEIAGVSVDIQGFDRYYLAQFTAGGVQFEVETTKVPLEELEAMLTALLSQLQ